MAGLPHALTREQAEARRSANPGPIEEAFFAHRGRMIHKWVHYLPIYDRWLAPYRDRSPTMLEIGVSKGGSLELWRSYFGPEATIFGIDIDPACAERFDAPNQVRIGSQDDPIFLASVLDEMGDDLDILLDDGSHIGRHQVASFRYLWPRVKPGGLYIIEDLHTSYWRNWEGGMRLPGTGVEFVKRMIEDQHVWYHSEPPRVVKPSEIGGIHFYDSIVIIEKISGHQPGHFMTDH